jgi:hypothetical protein
MSSNQVKFPANRAGLPGKETILILHPFSPPTRRGLRDVLPVKKTCGKERHSRNLKLHGTSVVRLRINSSEE